MNSGAFLVARDIFENPIWINPTEFRMFILILGKAAFAEEGVNVGNMHIKKGQWIRSYRNLQSDLEYVENNAVKRPGLATIERTVKKLVKDGRILAEPCELGTLFTVVNYTKYQALEGYKKGTRNTARNSSGTAAEQQRNNNNNANNAEEDININNNPPISPQEKIKHLDYVYLTPDEHERLVTEFGHEDTQWMIEQLDIYIGQNPKKNNRYTDHNRALRGWVKEKLIQKKEGKVSQFKPRNRKRQSQREEETDFGFHKI